MKYLNKKFQNFYSLGSYYPFYLLNIAISDTEALM